MNYFDENVGMAFLLTIIAGLSTGIGSAIAYFTKRTNKSMLAIAMGFSAGVMVYVSFMDIIPKAAESLATAMSTKMADMWSVVGFFGGVFVIFIIDRLIPSYENPHDIVTVEEINEKEVQNRKLYRIGVFAAIAIGIHNFPEGIATFTAYLIDPVVGISIAIAIALHNIPEGIAVSAPIYYATNDRKKAFWLSFSSGLAEPVGALIGYVVLMNFLTPMVFGILFSSVAGIMVYISIDELVPTAREYDNGHKTIYGFVGGMALMALSIILLA